MRRFLILVWLLEQAVVVGCFAVGQQNHQPKIAKITTTALSAASVQPGPGRKCPFRAISEALHLGEAAAAGQAVSNRINPFDGIHGQEQERRQSTDKTASIVRIALLGLLGSSSESAVLSPLELWCVDNIEASYEKVLAWKCPFFRRRASDMLDAADMLMRFLIIRDKTNLLGPPPSLRGVQGPLRREKTIHLTREELLEVIKSDWRVHNNKGYYITGRLSTNIYRDDCFFDGPDPDMPVKGLRKYLNAASQLFEQRTSRAELLDLGIEGDVVVAKWRFQGTLHLPWRPRMPQVLGTTTYHMDEDCLIYKHEESWDISAYEAFFWTMMPDQIVSSPRKNKALTRHLREALLFV